MKREFLVSYQCAECMGDVHERIPSMSAGDEGWNVCPDCRTVEGTWLTHECEVEGTTCLTTPMFDKDGKLVDECPYCANYTYKD